VTFMEIAEKTIQSAIRDGSTITLPGCAGNAGEIPGYSVAGRMAIFRNLRNSIAHEYPEEAEQTVAALNTLFEQWLRMETMYIQIRASYRARQA